MVFMGEWPLSFTEGKNFTLFFMGEWPLSFAVGKTSRFFMGNGLYVLSSLEYGTPRVAGAPTFLFKVSVEVKKRTTIVSR